MDLVIVAGAVIVAILLFSLFRSRGKQPSSRSRMGKTAQSKSARAGESQWRSVEIQPGLLCCASVRKMANRVFLAREAPGLPLDVCTLKKCECKYKFLHDRRSGEDRRDFLGHLGGFFDPGEDRRTVSGRRASDLAF